MTSSISFVRMLKIALFFLITILMLFLTVLIWDHWL